jgi:hypothetical protein
MVSSVNIRKKHVEIIHRNPDTNNIQIKNTDQVVNQPAQEAPLSHKENIVQNNQPAQKESLPNVVTVVHRSEPEQSSAQINSHIPIIQNNIDYDALALAMSKVMPAIQAVPDLSTIMPAFQALMSNNIGSQVNQNNFYNKFEEFNNKIDILNIISEATENDPVRKDEIKEEYEFLFELKNYFQLPNKEEFLKKAEKRYKIYIKLRELKKAPIEEGNKGKVTLFLRDLNDVINKVFDKTESPDSIIKHLLKGINNSYYQPAKDINQVRKIFWEQVANDHSIIDIAKEFCKEYNKDRLNKDEFEDEFLILHSVCSVNILGDNFFL